MLLKMATSYRDRWKIKEIEVQGGKSPYSLLTMPCFPNDIIILPQELLHPWLPTMITIVSD